MIWDRERALDEAERDEPETDQPEPEIPVRCQCGWDDEGTLTQVDVWCREYPPIPYVRIVEFDGRTADYDPPTQGHYECPACGEELEGNVVRVRR